MKFFRLLLPGLLVATTGVGAGDLITAGLAGHHVGMILWVPLVGAILKYALTEGIARYQFATGKTLIHGWIEELSPWIKWLFFLYLFIWSYAFGAAIINACGSAMNTLFPIENGKVIYGIAQSIIAMLLVLPGNFRLFEILMTTFVFIMFVTVVGTAFFFLDSPMELVQGLTSFHLFDFKNPWSIAVLGGVGGTITIVCYGYWLQEEKRSGDDALRITKIDLGVSYFLTGLFSVAMIIIGTRLHSFVEGGENFIHLISDLFANQLGPIGKTIFQWGFWAGVFSSLLGVWQSVPYLFADTYAIHKKKSYPDLKKSKPYRLFLVMLALVPITSLTIKFQTVQLLYAIFGALFIPLCALSLLILNNFHIKDKKYKNSKAINVLLITTFLFFVYTGIKQLI